MAKSWNFIVLASDEWTVESVVSTAYVPRSYGCSGGTPDTEVIMQESHLTSEQMSELERELQRAVERVERSIKTSGKAARPVKLDQTSVGRLSRIDALQNQHLSQGLQARDNARYAELSDALERLQRGDYGLCVGCGGPIPFERLIVFPETPRCATCGPAE
ncbi:MAG: hypothetical protein GEU90_06140 [Gemmatimonas sp.]|nr:hypothetical protein [Gemmatimonas sp.]